MRQALIKCHSERSEESPKQVRCFVGAIHESPEKGRLVSLPYKILVYAIIESNYKLEILRFRFASLRMTFVELFQLDKCQFIILPVSADIAE
jgi:hypothetical protein